MFVEEASNTEIKEQFGFTIDKKSRERLEGLGYIKARKSKELRGAFVHELTEQGWIRCRAELASETPPGAPKAYRLAYGYARSIDRFLAKSKLTMADYFVPDGTAKAAADLSADPAVEAVEADDLAVETTEAAGTVEAVPAAVTPDDEIRGAYDSLASRPRAWVNLSRLRDALPHLSRDEVDEALLRLDLEPWAYLIPEANQKTLSEADRDAAIHVGGEDKHLLSIEHA
ncbi:hypothetical protein RM788_21445 [Umezawaea sp. Da 62-37]|nr:hypothetical protein [Umezawaea sp. Da 62-37]WNV91902.1 hypothetical protein RM788_21445 [Umezawaea sp. Da 62-37]